MRLWNRLLCGDIVLYNNCKYKVIKKYEKDGKNVVDIENGNGIVTAISPFDVEKVED